MNRYGLSYRKEKQARYLSHLDLVRTFERAMRRADLPLAYTEGFNPHPKISFAAPLSVGISGWQEYMDLELLEAREPESLISALNPQMPPGLTIQTAFVLPERISLMAETAWAEYQVKFKAELTPEALLEINAKYLQQSAISVLRETKSVRQSKGRIPAQEFDIRSGIKSLSGEKQAEQVVLTWVLKCGSQGNIKLSEAFNSWLELAGLQAENPSVTRTQLWAKEQVSFPALGKD